MRVVKLIINRGLGNEHNQAYISTDYKYNSTYSQNKLSYKTVLFEWAITFT